MNVDLEIILFIIALVCTFAGAGLEIYSEVNMQPNSKLDAVAFLLKMTGMLIVLKHVL